ncbi:MAG TPA: FecR domain-containing protein [Thermoanaerobaculia bacterium]|nr:FecR domain-containing protein [Thermoanaerobaculia bacterium]
MNDERDDAVAQLVRLAGARPKPDPQRMARVREAVHDEWRRTTRRRQWTRYGIAAAVAATLAGVLVFTRVPSTRVIETRTGEVTSIEWSGATLRIDGETRIRLDANAHATLERGTLFFESHTHTGVTIDTPFGAVRDIGTRFELRVGEHDLHVRVSEGMVDVRGTRADAGMELVATRDAVTPFLTLEGQTLGDVIEHAARVKGLRVEWHTRRDVVLRGSVALTPDEAIEAATAASGARYRIDGNTLIVSGGE